MPGTVNRWSWGAANPADFSGKRACAQRARLPAVAITLPQTYTHPSHPANAAGGPRSEPAWSVGSRQLGAVRGSCVATDAAPGQRAPLLLSAQRMCVIGAQRLHAPHREPALDIGGLRLSFYFIYLLVLLSLRNDLVCPEPAFSPRKYLCPKMERKIT